MAELPDLGAVLREQAEANDLMLASALRWVARCAGCGNHKITSGSNGMPAGHELRRAGWSAQGGKAYCPGCLEIF